MRLTSELWVKAYLRRVMADGHFATVVRHGDDTAGAIFVKVSLRDGTALLFGPAFASFDSPNGERAFTPLLDGTAKLDRAVDEFLEAEQRFDTDLWIVEVERADGDPMLGDWLRPTGRS